MSVLYRIAMSVGLCLSLSNVLTVSVVAQVPTSRAAGDGRTDDTAALQSVIDRGGRIELYGGRYRITRPLVIDLQKLGPTSLSGAGPATIVMAGPGPAIRVIGTHDGTAAPASVRPEVWLRERTPCIDGIAIEGNHAEADGIEVTGAMQPILSRITVRHARHGLILTGRNRNVVIADCHIYDNRGIGILFDKLNLHQVNITGCHISYNHQGGLLIRDSEIRNLQVGTCDIEGNMSPDEAPTANIMIDARAGSVREIAVIGCTLQHSHDAPDSANIRCIGVSADENQKIGHMTIADNVLSDVAVNIHLRYCRGVTISGNTIWKGFRHNVLLEGSSDVVMSGNLLDRNPDYRPADSPNTILLDNCRDCVLRDLHINGALEQPALTLRQSQWCSVRGCDIRDCPLGGILLQDCGHCVVSHCLIRQPTGGEGLTINGGHDNEQVDNKVVLIEAPKD